MKVALSVGCPCGVGPEVAVAAAALVREQGEVVLVGDRRAIGAAARLRGVDLSALSHVQLDVVSDLSAELAPPGHPTPEAGRAQLAAFDRAIDLVLAGEVDAIVTGPVSKYAITRSGVRFVGHTEHLEARVGGDARAVMMFAGPRLRTSLVSTHVAIAELPSVISFEAVERAVRVSAHALMSDFGVAYPRLAVAGLNPHAGEGGLFGTEERDTIAPAIANVAAEFEGRARIVGPLPAETAFRQARDGAWDAVVAMFHDQATIASKLLDFGDAVNVTLGLPVVRTSVDHGTGYDIAWRGVADPSGMRAALEMAFAIAARRRG